VSVLVHFSIFPFVSKPPELSIFVERRVMGQSSQRSFIPKIVNTILLLVLFFFSVASTYAAESDDQKKQKVYELYESYRKDFPMVVDISPSAAMVLLEEERVIFIDTRDPEEMAVSIIPNAIDKDSFLKSPKRFDGKTLVAYCTIGYRSGVFAKEMAGKGIDVRNLSGGIIAWVLEGGKIFDSKGETHRLHVYSDKWNFAPDGYETVVYGFIKKMLK
jgi:rhodanese-related sulfurtransferase